MTRDLHDGGHVVLVDPRDARLRARVAGDEADEERDHDRVREQRARAGAASGAAPSGPCAATARPRSFEDLLDGRSRRAARPRARARGRRARPPRGSASRSRRRRRRCAARSTTSQTRRRWPGSSDAVGSSSRRTRGSARSESATFRRWRFPTESSPDGRVLAREREAVEQPRRPRRRVAHALELREELEVLARGEARVVRGALRHPADATRVASTMPSLASIAPARIASSVDLPAPFGPTSATASPSTSSKSVGASASTSP